MAPLKAVLLDVDGTLVDSNDAHANAWVDAFTEFGIETTFERVRSLIGMGSDKLVPAIAPFEKDSPQGKKLSDRRQAIFFETYLPTITAFPGVRAFVDRLKARGLQVIVASSANEEELEKLLAIAGVPELEPKATSSSDAAQSKPDPDIIEAALERAGCEASEALMVGDTPYDLEAAERAGVGAVAFRSGGWPDEKLRGAVAVFDGPADVVARFDASPFATDAPHESSG